MQTRLRYVRCLPLPGLAVMTVAGWWAARYTPFWFDPGETCLSRSPCYGEAESVAALRTLSWVAWAGLLLVVAGVALSARALPSTPGHTLAGPSRWGHALGAAGVAGGAALLGGLVTVFAVLGMSTQLGWAVVVGTWIGLARVLEELDRALGRRARGARASYLLAMAAGLIGLVGGAVSAGSTRSVGWGLVAGCVTVAAVTALGDAVPGHLVPPPVAVATTATVAVAVLAAGLRVLGLLDPPAAPLVTGTPRTADLTPPTPPATRPPAATPPPTGSPTTPSRTGAPARRPCRAGDLRLQLGGFDAAMGERAASLTASNGSGSSCYLDGFATVTLRQGGVPLDLRTGTTSSERPGRGRARHPRGPRPR